MRLFKSSLTIFLFSALLLSCGKSTAVEEESISVTPSTLTASVELASYDLTVTTSAAWLCEVSGESGADASWLSLSKSKGAGDSKITVRVLQNKYNAERKATIKFTTTGGASTSVSVTQEADSKGETMSFIKVRLGSYNLRMSSADTDETNGWDVRKGRLLTSIKENEFDIFGLQEVSTVTQTWLKTNFGSTYGIFIFSPYAQDGVGDKAQGIMYKKADFSISDQHFFWASDTPDSGTVNDTGSSGSFRRGGMCAVLTHKGTGIKIFFMNTHACLNKEPNAAAAHVYVDMEKRYNTSQYPSFFVGDMNANPALAAISTYKAHWTDSFETAETRNSVAATYNGYKYPTGSNRIDYVFYRGNGIKINEFMINNTLYGGLYASDHFPVWADVTITK